MPFKCLLPVICWPVTEGGGAPWPPGPAANTFSLTLNGTRIPISVRQQADNSLLCSYGGALRFVSGMEEPLDQGWGGKWSGARQAGRHDFRDRPRLGVAKGGGGSEPLPLGLTTRGWGLGGHPTASPPSTSPARGLRVVINGLTYMIPNVIDPSELRSDVNGRLPRWLGHIRH